jgi:hypothetical protein
MIYKNGTKNFVKNFQRAGKNGSRGGKFLPVSREQNCEAILRQSASGFCSKCVRISSNKHHHIEFEDCSASPLPAARASAGNFARNCQGFLKSISSRPRARRRFEPIFFFRLWRKAKRDFIKLSVSAFPFLITIKR